MKCKYCLTKFEVKRFNQKHCMETEECRDAAIKFVLDNNRRLAEKKEADKWKEEKKVMSDKLKTMGDYEKDLLEIQKFYYGMRGRRKGLFHLENEKNEHPFFHNR